MKWIEMPKPNALAVLLLAVSIALLSRTARAFDDAPADLQPPTDKASLYKCLDSDFEQLLKSEDADPQPMREAAALLAGTNQNSRWTDFFKATAIIREHRSKAAIPLLMKFIVEHAAFGSGRIALQEYVDAIRMLTGEKIEYLDVQGRDRQSPAVDAVLKLYTDWWQPNKKTITTNIDKMTDDQVKYLTSELLRHAESQSGTRKPGDRHISTQAQYEALDSSLGQSSGGRQEWWDQELNHREVTLLLAAAGWAETPTDDPTAGQKRVAFAAVPLLAGLQKDGEAPMLAKIAGDSKQNNATRLTCILALHAAGVDVHSRDMLAIYAADKRLECRVLSLLMLSICDKNDAVVPRLVDALDDDNQEIRVAALSSLRALNPKAALPKLTRVMQEGQPADLIDPGIRLLGTIGGDSAAGVLVDYMEKTLKEGSSNRSALARALLAFSDATGKRWVQAGANSPAYYEEQARQAVAAWRADHP